MGFLFDYDLDECFYGVIWVFIFGYFVGKSEIEVMGGWLGLGFGVC